MNSVHVRFFSIPSYDPSYDPTFFVPLIGCFSETKGVVFYVVAEVQFPDIPFHRWGRDLQGTPSQTLFQLPVLCIGGDEISGSIGGKKDIDTCT